LRIGRRWPEDGMPKCEVIFARALSTTANYLLDLFPKNVYDDA